MYIRKIFTIKTISIDVVVQVYIVLILYTGRVSSIRRGTATSC